MQHNKLVESDAVIQRTVSCRVRGPRRSPARQHEIKFKGLPMFCPKCRTEYGKGFLTCADCEVALVAHMPPEPPAPQKPDYVKYAHLYSPKNGIELMLLKSILDSEGINYYV